jgi:antitoxin component YwqK of YwqJK toxin-antitoxin module
MAKTRTRLALLILFSEAFLSCDQAEKKKFYYENGAIKSIAEMKDGLMHGEHEFYYPSGKIYSRGNYRMGKENGLAEHFFREWTIEV